MPPVQRQGDLNIEKGPAESGVGSVRVNGQPIVVNGIKVAPHFKGHKIQFTSGGNGTVRAADTPVITAGCIDTCKHARQGGSPDVRVG